MPKRVDQVTTGAEHTCSTTLRLVDRVQAPKSKHEATSLHRATAIQVTSAFDQPGDLVLIDCKDSEAWTAIGVRATAGPCESRITGCSANAGYHLAHMLRACPRSPVLSSQLLGRSRGSCRAVHGGNLYTDDFYEAIRSALSRSICMSRTRHRPLPRPRGPADSAVHPRQAGADQAAGGAEAGHHPPRRDPRPRPQRPPQALRRGVAGGCSGALGDQARESRLLGHRRLQEPHSRCHRWWQLLGCANDLCSRWKIRSRWGLRDRRRQLSHLDSPRCTAAW